MTPQERGDAVCRALLARGELELESPDPTVRVFVRRWHGERTGLGKLIEAPYATYWYVGPKALVRVGSRRETSRPVRPEIVALLVAEGTA